MSVIDMHDYPPAARLYWWCVWILGMPILAVSFWRIVSLPPALAATALAGATLASAIGYFPVHIPRTRTAIAGAEIFIILMLLIFGIPGGVLAASAEGFFGSYRASTRWTSRLGTPAMAAVNMFVCGSALEVMRRGAESGGLGAAGLVMSVVAFTALYYGGSTLIVTTLFALKRQVAFAPLEWLAEGHLIALWYVASGSIASLLYITFQQFGWPVLLVAAPIVAMFMSTWHTLDRLDIANRRKSEFLANVSHELRTPLNCIIGGSEILKDGIVGQMTPQQVEWARDIHESGKHLLTLINDILDLSRIEAGRTELQLGTFDLAACVANAVTLVKERASRHGIRLVCDVDASAGSITADERKVKQVLLNLLSNAVKFTPDGGTVTVRGHRTPAGVEVSVMDTGVGIAEADHQAVFEAFRQVGTDDRSKAEGTGLGLALARDLVLLHSGSIRLASEPGKGSTFTVWLPDRPPVGNSSVVIAARGPA